MSERAGGKGRESWQRAYMTKQKTDKKQQERQRKEGERQRERHGDYDNAEAAAVQLWLAAVSTEEDEA